MDIIQILTVVIGGLIALLGYNVVKRRSAEALNENLDTKNQINDISAEQAKNDGLLKSEEQKRQELEDQANKDKAAPTDPQALADFFNKDKP